MSAPYFSAFSGRRGGSVPSPRRSRKSRQKRRSMSSSIPLGTLETLESRQMLSAVPADYTRVSPDWFGTVAPASVSEVAAGQWDPSATPSADKAAGSMTTSGNTADPQQWIVRFSEQAVGAIAGLSHAVAAIEGSMSGFRVLAGLGLPGQLLLETTAPLSKALESLAGRGDLVYFEPSTTISLGATAASIPNDHSFGSLYGLHNIGQSGGT